MATQTVVSESRSKMQKALDVLQDELKAFRGGRATPALVDHLRVEYYGSPTPLKSLATVSAPEADMLVIKPFDPASLKNIEKAIKSSDLSIAPVIEGKFIRLNIPPLSGERRKQLVQQAKQAGEQAKVSIRNIRRIIAISNGNISTLYTGLCGVKCIPASTNISFKPGMHIHGT